MNNQQNPSGTPMPGNDIRVQNDGATAGNTAASRIGASNTESPAVSPPASSRKSAGSTSTSGASGAANQGPTNSNSDNDGQSANNQESTLVDTALQSGKKWVEDSGILNSVNQLPQSLKDFGNRAVARVGDLTTTQKVVGGTLLVVGLGWLATRKGKSSDNNSHSTNAAQGKSSYGRSYGGYQAPDANRSMTSGRKGSGASYNNSRGTSNYGSGSNYTSGASTSSTPNTNTGINSGSGRTNSSPGFGSTSASDAGSRTSESSYRPTDDFRSIE